VKWGAPALAALRESLARREELLPVIRKWSPDALLHPAHPDLFENSGPDEARQYRVGNYTVHSRLGQWLSKTAEKQAPHLVKFPDHPTRNTRHLGFIAQN